MQLPGLTPHYTKNPVFPDMVSALIVAALIAIGMNFAMALLRKRTTDIDKMNRVMKETNEWRKQYTDAIRKRDKVRVEELKKKQASVNKNDNGDAAAANAAHAHLYDALTVGLDTRLSSHIWCYCWSFSYPNSLDNL
jgi:Flp pilus assembly protein TadB